MRGIRTETRGTQHRPVRLTGGFRFMTFNRTMQWPSIRATGIGLSKNSSKGYNYYLWNQQNRGPHVAQYLKDDPRPLPKATEQLQLDPQIRLIVPAGGIVLFSGAQMHSSVPNTSGKTRFSIDFRVVHEDDVKGETRCPHHGRGMHWNYHAGLFARH